MATKPKLCGDCGEEIPKAADWPALKVLGGNRCEACDKLLCPQCLWVDEAGTVYCGECAEAADIDAVVTVGKACVICGCSEFNACEGGCHWVHDVDAGEPPRCSRCPKP